MWGLGLPESGWPSTGEAKARGAESQPLGPTALPQARQSGLSGDWRQASVSLHLGSPTCPETPFLNVQDPLSRARPERDRILDRHGNSIRNPCGSHPTPDSVSLFFSRLNPGPHRSPSALKRKPWGGPWGPSQPALFAVQPPLSPSLPARAHPISPPSRAPPSHCCGDHSSLVRAAGMPEPAPSATRCPVMGVGPGEGRAKIRLSCGPRSPGGVCREEGWAVTPPRLPQVLPYDYCGAYGHRAREDYAYGRLLGQEYTFSFPPHHDVVGPQPQGAESWAALWAGRGRRPGSSSPLPASSLYPHPVLG